MARLDWNPIGSKIFETGVDRGVLYVPGQNGVVWNGLVSVIETPSGGETRSFYYDGKKFLNVASSEEMAGTINAYYSPPEFDVCDGSSEPEDGVYAWQQRRSSFGLSFRTKTGNDINGLDSSYKIHIIYNLLAAPSERPYKTNSSEPEPLVLSWEYTTKPVPFPDYLPTAHVTIDANKAPSWAIQQLETILYGTETTDARLPSPEEIIFAFNNKPLFTVTDLGDGVFEIYGADEEVTFVDAGQYTISGEQVVSVDGSTYTISSAT